jgi:hypothetical protein
MVLNSARLVWPEDGSSNDWTSDSIRLSLIRDLMELLLGAGLSCYLLDKLASATGTSDI